MLYDGVKADIFSAAATLFLLKMKYQPFRRAHPNDPYYKKLAFKGKKYFWKIYSKVPTTALFKDIFEKMICLETDSHPSLDEESVPRLRLSSLYSTWHNFFTMTPSKLAALILTMFL